MKSLLFPLLFAGVGVPLIIADAASTSRDLDAHSKRADAAHEAQCVGMVEQHGVSRQAGQSLCRCVVREVRAVRRRGADRPEGANDQAAINAMIGRCARAAGIDMS